VTHAARGWALVALAVPVALAAGLAHGGDRVLASTTARVVTAGAGVKAGTRCTIRVTAARGAPTGCFRACAARVTCGRRVFELERPTCEAPDVFSSDAICQAAFTRQVFTAVGGNGRLDLADGLATVGTGEDVAVLRFAGGRQRLGDPEGKPAGRLRDTLKIAAVAGPVPVKARTCAVELAYYTDPKDHSCDHRCVAKLTCGDLRQSRQGYCEVPSSYESADGKCRGDIEALTFHDDRSGTELVLDRRRTGRAGTVPLSSFGHLDLTR